MSYALATITSATYFDIGISKSLHNDSTGTVFDMTHEYVLH